MNETLCCHSCGLMLQDDPSANQLNCPRCDTCVRKKESSIENDLGLALAALILFFPAMTLPIISFKLGDSIQLNTMLSAFEYFHRDGYPELGALVFFTSIIAPFVQIVVSVLMFTALYEKRRPRFMKFYFKILYMLKHWVMLDVYVIAILVSIVKLNGTSDVIYGSGLIMFVFLTCFSFLLSWNFSPKKIWKAYYAAH